MGEDFIGDEEDVSLHGTGLPFKKITAGPSVSIKKAVEKQSGTNKCCDGSEEYPILSVASKGRRCPWVRRPGTFRQMWKKSRLPAQHITYSGP